MPHKFVPPKGSCQIQAQDEGLQLPFGLNMCSRFVYRQVNMQDLMCKVSSDPGLIESHNVEMVHLTEETGREHSYGLDFNGLQQHDEFRSSDTTGEVPVPSGRRLQDEFPACDTFPALSKYV